MPKSLLSLLLAAALLAAASLNRPASAYAMPAEAAAAAIQVNSSLADVPDAAPGNGICETAAGNGVCTLRAAIMEANALPGPDTILLPAGTYTLTRPGYEDAALNGDLDITGDLTLLGAGMDTTLIDGNGGVTQGRVLQVHTGVTTRLAGVCLQNGYGPDDSGDDYGGGIHNAGHLTLESACVRYNHAVFAGGGLLNAASGTLIVLNSFITANSTNNLGGGIANHGSLTIVGSALSQNDAELYGGGVYAPSGSVQIADSRLTANTTYEGGGIYLGAGVTLDMQRSTLNGNVAVYQGGAIYVYRSLVSLTNVTISGNLAGHNGGGLALISGPSGAVGLFNVTIANNRADNDNNGFGFGGGIYRDNDAAVLSMGNSVLANNALERGVADILNDCAATIQSQGYNLVRVSAGCNLTGVTNGNKTAMDPLLQGLGNNGGPTPSLALQIGSPAIDSGNPAGCGDALGARLLFDQRGYFRHTGARCDMGAFEHHSSQPFAQHLPLLLH